MTTNQKTQITVILTEELTECGIGAYEIRNTVSKMDAIAIGAENAVDKTKLEEACAIARTYLNSITLPVSMMAMNAIYRNKVLIATAKIYKTIK